MPAAKMDGVAAAEIFQFERRDSDGFGLKFCQRLSQTRQIGDVRENGQVGVAAKLGRAAGIHYTPSPEGPRGAVIAARASDRSLMVVPGDETVESVLRRVGDTMSALVRVGQGPQTDLGPINFAQFPGTAGAPVTQVGCGVLLQSPSRTTGQDVFVMRRFEVRPLDTASSAR